MTRHPRRRPLRKMHPKGRLPSRSSMHWRSCPSVCRAGLCWRAWRRPSSLAASAPPSCRPSFKRHASLINPLPLPTCPESFEIRSLKRTRRHRRQPPSHRASNIQAFELRRRRADEDPGERHLARPQLAARSDEPCDSAEPLRRPRSQDRILRRH